jgi:hypothetical protein
MSTQPDVMAFVDPPRVDPETGIDPLTPEQRKLFDDFGLEAWTIIADMQENSEQQRQIEEDIAWDAKKSLRDDEDDDEDVWVDLGSGVPDTYGGG